MLGVELGNSRRTVCHIWKREDQVSRQQIVSVAAAEAAGSATGSLERRTVEIRGRKQLIEVIVLRPGEA